MREFLKYAIIVLFGILFAVLVVFQQYGYSQESTDNLRTVLTVGIITSNAADYATTRYALSRGLREGNPLMAHFLRREPMGVGVKAAGIVFAVWAVRKLLSEPKHRKWGIVLGVGIIGLNGWLAVHNVRVGILR